MFNFCLSLLLYSQDAYKMLTLILSFLSCYLTLIDASLHDNAYFS